MRKEKQGRYKLIPSIRELAARYNRGYPEPMKTAISIPDPLFAAAERASRKLGMSRSQFYSKAVEAYLKANRTQDKEALDAVYGEEDSQLDPVLAMIQDASLQPKEW
jgi:hypothetical protein